MSVSRLYGLRVRAILEVHVSSANIEGAVGCYLCIYINAGLGFAMVLCLDTPL